MNDRHRLKECVFSKSASNYEKLFRNLSMTFKEAGFLIHDSLKTVFIPQYKSIKNLHKKNKKR